MDIDVSVVALLLVQFNNDREVIGRLKEEGMNLPVEEMVFEPGDLQFDELDVSTFEEGIAQMELDNERRVIQLIKDTLDNSVRRLYGRDPEVTNWVESLGGLRKVQEELCGISLKPGDWYQTTVKKLQQEQGYDIPALGEPVVEYEIERATHYDSYAALVHREVKNQEHYGLKELSEEETDSVPNWALTEYDKDSKFRPWWWKFISIGKFNATPKAEQKAERELTKGWKPEKRNIRELCMRLKGKKVMQWIPDIRISEEIGTRHFHQITENQPWSVMEDNPQVREFTYRFYWYPSQLKWVKIGYGEYTRWAAGMIIGAGEEPGSNLWMWAPMTHPSSKKFDFWKANDGKKYEPKKKRALYYKNWIIAYRKAGDKQILVETWRVNPQSSNREQPIQFERWSKEILDPFQWGASKKKILSKGGKDAYFGWPELCYQAPPKPMGTDTWEGTIPGLKR